uniref:(3R)-3-hydroxyacyl-CoA dehydrogenase n=1 Tax=Strigamia maritima TaxID=126957 RepID=T1IUU5_STRMM
MLNGRIALITGAGSGIGRAISQVLAKANARIIAADINENGVKETINQLGNADEHMSIKADVGEPSVGSLLISQIKNKYKQPPDIVVNCAGITADNFITNMSEVDFDRVLRINVKGTYLVIKAATDAMIEHKMNQGSIINIGSIVGKVGNMGQINYAASKAAVGGMTKTTAKEMAKFNIRCNAILPGFIDTPIIKSVPEKLAKKLLKIIPLGRLGTANEIADVCLFLASDQSSFITGSEIEVTGGVFM